jgi:hypothetical protein
VREDGSVIPEDELQELSPVNLLATAVSMVDRGGSSEPSGSVNAAEHDAGNVFSPSSYCSKSTFLNITKFMCFLITQKGMRNSEYTVSVCVIYLISVLGIYMMSPHISDEKPSIFKLLSRGGKIYFEGTDASDTSWQEMLSD